MGAIMKKEVLLFLFISIILIYGCAAQESADFKEVQEEAERDVEAEIAGGSQQGFPSNSEAEPEPVSETPHDLIP